MNCPVRQAEIDHDITQMKAELHWEFFGKDEQREKVAHVEDLAVRLLGKQPTNIRIIGRLYDYKRDDVLDDLLNHSLFESCRAAYRAGNRKPYRDLVIRVTQRGIARSMYGAFDADEMGFLK